MDFRIVAFIMTALFFPVQALAQSSMTFDQAISEGQSFGHAQPKGSGAANSLINNAQREGVPGLTPQAQSNAQAQGSFYLANPDQLRPQGEAAIPATDTGQFVEQSYNLRLRYTIAPDDPLVVLGETTATDAKGCVTQRTCSQPTTEVVTTTNDVTCSIEYAENGAQCTYALPQPTTEWRPWLKIELVGQYGAWTFRLYVDTTGDGSYDLTLLNPSGVQDIVGFNTSAPFMYELGSGSCGSWFCITYWGLTSSGWYTLAAPGGSWWSVPKSGPYENRQAAANYLKEMVRQAYGIPAEEIRLQSGSEWFGEGWCFNLEDDRCYSAVWERSYVIPPPPVSQETINAACGLYIGNSNCALVSEQCTTLSCTRSYVCVDPSQLIDGCATYRDQGCTLQSDTCALANPYGDCLSQQEVYACTTQTIKEGCGQEAVQVVCPQAPTGIRCLDPTECADTTSVPDTDLALAASNMDSLNAVQHDHTQNPIVIFTGDRERCRRTIASSITRDCCALDTFLLGCNSSEELLQSHRNAGDCVQVGTYCSDELNLGFTSVCIEHTTSFCCFSSKLARIIQEQGRPQLGIGWGTAQSPDCRGFTTTELEAINFEAIDFSEYYADITAHPPDPNQLSSQAQSSQALTADPNSVPSSPGGINDSQVQQDINTFFGTHIP